MLTTNLSLSLYTASLVRSKHKLCCHMWLTGLAELFSFSTPCSISPSSSAKNSDRLLRRGLSAAARGRAKEPSALAIVCEYGLD